MVEIASLAPGTRAGVAAFGNRDNLLAVTVERPEKPAAGGALTINVWQKQKGQSTTVATQSISAGDHVYLQLKAMNRTRFDFAVSPDGKSWTTVAAQAEGGYLPPWDLAVRVAMLVSGPPGASARFGRFALVSGP